MQVRGYILAGSAVIALVAATVTAVAATDRPATSSSTAARGNGMMRGQAIGSGCAPLTLPGQRVTVMLSDMPTASMMGGGGMMARGSWPMAGRMMMRTLPSHVNAGTVSLVAINHGTRTHELVVLPLSAEAPPGSRGVATDGTVSEVGSFGEASQTCGAGSGDGVRAGGAGWVTVNLGPGRYELLCNLPGHYAAGMYSELDVR